VWAPVLAAAQGLAWTADELGADIPLHGYTGFHQRIVFATTVLFAWLVALFGWRAARRFVGGRWGPAVAATAIVLGTSLTYYATYMPSYPHVMDAFFAAAFFHYWATTVGRRDLRRFALLGALLGMATLVRSQELALGVVVVVEIATKVGAIALGHPDALAAGERPWPAAAAWVGRGALALAVTLALFSIQLYEWHVVYGSWGRLPQGPKFTRWGHPFILETLFSERNGWFSTTPLAYLGAIGLLLVPRRHRVVGVGLLAALLVQIYLCSIVFDWWSSASFSQRRLCSMSYPLIVGLAMLLVGGARLAARLRVPRWGRHGIAVAGIGWLVGWNLGMVFPLHSGKAANAGIRAPCCGHVPRPFRWIAEPVYRAVGNPFALPASAWFALRYHVGIHRWDRAVGAYALVPGLDDLGDDSYLEKARGNWNLGGAGIAPWLLGGFGPAQPAPKGAPAHTFRWTTAARARAMVPELMPDGERARLWLAPGGSRHVVVKWNDVVVAEATLGDGWTPVPFDVTADLIETGTNVIEIDAEVAAVAPEAAPGLPPPKGGAAGVAVGKLELRFIPPEPAAAPAAPKPPPRR